MRTRRVSVAVLGPRLMVAVVAAALFGVLSMHGWGSHALTHESSIVAPTASHASHDQIGHDLRTPDAHGAPAASAADHGSGGSNGLAMLGTCLAVVTVLLLGLGLLSLRHRLPVPRALLPCAVATSMLGRGRDSPDPLRLCVIRC